MLELLLIRHAATEWNAEKKLQGRRDIPLSQLGRDSLSQRAIPPELRERDWFCSPLLRTQQTAELLGIPHPSLSDSWIEMDWGDWEGRRITELRQQQPQLMKIQEQRGLDMTPPGGECPRQVRQRIGAWLASQDPQDSLKRIGVVTHKGVIRALLSDALEWDMLAKCPIKQDWQCALLLHYQQGKLTLQQHNISLLTDAD
ncbi:histidine phosphatase family protein [Motiliproteus coralliicola]|uniref:Histidine phosphatase family protein n=1 Tax=Motiliproteus coralliicola TaxID=2283196 RepID=A0A369WD44_9GAMM|nr:histidine phosphatase family protein [Motiliproteus coralliicola]RDE19557.1 histidine phosphatase family protein [Motiliproteus coralliicola]